MKIYISFLIFNLCLLSVTAQSGKNIEVPFYNGPSEISSTETFYRFYVTTQEKLYFEDKRLQYRDEVSTSLLVKQRSTIIHPENEITVVADKNVSYEFIEKLRKNLIHYWKGNIHYIGQESDTLTALTIYTSGKEFKVKEFTNGQFYTEKHGDYIYEIGEKEKEIGLPLPPPYYQQVWGNVFHGSDLERFKNILKHPKFTYIAMEIISEEQYIWRSKKYYFNDTEKLKELVDFSKDILYVKAARDITYGQYFNALSSIQKFQKFIPRSKSAVI